MSQLGHFHVMLLTFTFYALQGTYFDIYSALKDGIRLTPRNYDTLIKSIAITWKTMEVRKKALQRFKSCLDESLVEWHSMNRNFDGKVSFIKVSTQNE